MTAALAAAAALAVITGAALYLRRHPVWQGPGVRHPGSPPRPPRQHPAPRDWGQSRLPSAADRTGQLAAIGDQAAGERVMPGRRDGLPHADADWDLAPWDDAAQPVTPEPDLPPLPRYLPAPARPHAAPDVPASVHDGCEISDTGQQAALTLLSERYELPPAGVASSEGLGPRPGDDDTRMCRDCASGYCGRAMCKPDDDCACPCSTWAKPLNCPCCVDGDALRCCICERNCGSSDCRCRSAPDDTVTDMRPVPAPVAAAENAAARWHLKAHVGYVMKRKPPLREYVEATIGPGVADLNPEYERDADAFTVPPAEDFDSLLATAAVEGDARAHAETTGHEVRITQTRLIIIAPQAVSADA